MKLADVVTPEELRDELEANKTMGSQMANQAAEHLRDYALALNTLMPLADFMCTMGVLEAIRRILERKGRPVQ